MDALNEESPRPRSTPGRLLAVRLLAAATLLAAAASFFFYPAFKTLSAVTSHSLRETGTLPGLGRDFRATAQRYRGWATGYLDTQRAAQLDHRDVAGTEWPIFGSTFLMLTAEELLKDGLITLDKDVRTTLALAAEVIAHPSTGTWVKDKWGDSYLHRENVFYRMLLLLGLQTYEAITQDGQYSTIIRTQATTLGPELLDQPMFLADDYPGECYPNDVLWAAASLQRAAAAGYWNQKDAARLSRGLMATLNGASMTPSGLPSFQVEADTGAPFQPARGSGNSGILCLAAELDPKSAQRWFAKYEENYWKPGPLLWGFRETPRGLEDFADVDSGPVIAGVGSVATGFGIGAARSVGRSDRAAPLIMETVAASWPTPFGLLVPGALGHLAADGWCFGELALQFSMTRPNRVPTTIPYRGGVPGVVWLYLCFYLAGGLGITWSAVRLVYPRARRAWPLDDAGSRRPAPPSLS